MGLRERSVIGCFPEFVFQFSVSQVHVGLQNNYFVLPWACAAGFNNNNNNNKPPGRDGFPVDCLKKGGITLLEWLVRLLSVSFDTVVVPTDWRGACIVPLYEGLGDKCECSN